MCFCTTCSVRINRLILEFNNNDNNTTKKLKQEPNVGKHSWNDFCLFVH